MMIYNIKDTLRLSFKIEYMKNHKRILIITLRNRVNNCEDNIGLNWELIRNNKDCGRTPILKTIKRLLNNMGVLHIDYYYKEIEDRLIVTKNSVYLKITKENFIKYGFSESEILELEQKTQPSENYINDKIIISIRHEDGRLFPILSITLTDTAHNKRARTCLDLLEIQAQKDPKYFIMWHIRELVIELEVLDYISYQDILNKLVVNLEGAIPEIYFIEMMEERKMNNKFKTKKVIFNEPATIVIWEDGTKTVVKCRDDEAFDPEKGLALCFMKRVFDNKGNYNNILRKECDRYFQEKNELLKETVQRIRVTNCPYCGKFVIFNKLLDGGRCRHCLSIIKDE